MHRDDLPLARLERFIAGLDPEGLAKARRFRPVREVPIGELGTHPDLGERLEQLVTQFPDVEVGIFYRMFAARTREGRVFAFAQGTHLIRFCVGPEGLPAAVELGAEADPEFGAEWAKVNAWNAEVRTAEWLKALRTLSRAAYQFATQR